jgi:hypothetical protein
MKKKKKPVAGGLVVVIRPFYGEGPYGNFPLLPGDVVLVVSLYDDSWHGASEYRILWPSGIVIGSFFEEEDIDKFMEVVG